MNDWLGPLVDKWAADEYVRFASRSDGQRTTTTVSRDALLLLAERAIAAERERCAQLCEQWDATHPQRLAANIRSTP